jgi:hypothetical protein
MEPPLHSVGPFGSSPQMYRLSALGCASGSVFYPDDLTTHREVAIVDIDSEIPDDPCAVNGGCLRFLDCDR